MYHRRSIFVSILAISGAVSMFVAGVLPKSTSVITLTPFPDADQLPCFASNADIAGIGMRVSTYAQSFLLCFTTFLCIEDGVVSSQERKALDKSCANLLITACALLVSAAVQAVASQLSIFHALIVLDWSWMLTINALIQSIIPTIDHQIERKFVPWIRSLYPARIGQWQAIILVSLHMSLMGAFGVYIWWHPTRFQGPDPNPGTMAGPDSVVCLHRTITYVFFVGIRASNPKLRTASIVFYSILAIPLINVIVLTAICMLIVKIFTDITLCGKPHTFVPIYRITWGVQTVVNIIIVINTERTMTRNKHLVSGGESIWGFGRIIAVILIVSPFIEALGVVKEKLKPKWKGQIEYWFQRILREGNNTWALLNREKSWAIRDFTAKLDNHDRHRHLNKDRRDAIIGAFTCATQFFNVARTFMEPQDEEHSRSPPRLHTRMASDTTQTQEDPQMLETKPLPDAKVLDWSSPSQTATYHIEHLRELVSKLCHLRLPNVQNKESFLAARGSLRATKEALDAALYALEAY